MIRAALLRRRNRSSPRAIGIHADLGESKGLGAGDRTRRRINPWHPPSGPPQACQQRDVRPAVEGKGSSASTPAPPYEVALFLVQSSMLGGRDFAGRARDQGPRALAGEPTDLDAKARSLFVELRPVSEASARCFKVSKLAARRRGRSPQTGRPSRHPGFADPGHSDNRMTFATYTRATEGTQVATTDALEEACS